MPRLPQTASRDRADYVKVQQIIARDMPTIPLWYQDNVVVHTRRLAKHPGQCLRQLRLPQDRNPRPLIRNLLSF